MFTVIKRSFIEINNYVTIFDMKHIELVFFVFFSWIVT
jgi:hypothetical protein